MRLTLVLFGTELDITLGPADLEAASSLDGGTTASTVVGFTRSVGPEWEVPGSYHQFEPE